MKKLVVLMVLCASVAYADFKVSDYTAMTNSIARLDAAAEIRAEFKGFFADWEKRKVRIQAHAGKLGEADAIILESYIAEITALYQSVNNGMTNIQSTYKVFLTGSDNVD